MECPVCRVTMTAGPYRASGRERQVSMRHLVHESGVAYDECPTCGGIFVEKAGLVTIEQAARRASRPGDAAALAFRRSYQAAIHPGDAPEARACPRCREEMFERPWSPSIAVKIDVCLECDGVWLDAGELDALDGRDRT